MHRGPFTGAALQSAFEALLSEVLGLEPAADNDWTPFGLFDGDGRCVATIEAAVLPLLVDRCRTTAAGIRSVAVAPRWRGQGLFRVLMTEALAWCEARASGPTLLYTAEPALYLRFGFRPLPQHAFIGPSPSPISATVARTLDRSHSHDRALIARIVEARTPVSFQAALHISAPLFLTNLAKDDAPALVLVGSDTLVAFEEEGDTLVIADVAGPAIPLLSVLYGALNRRSRRVRTLFPPDRLGWHGQPVVDDTGLMVRGEVPAAMTRPFMFPPTGEF